MNDPINSSMRRENSGEVTQLSRRTGGAQTRRWLKEADAEVPATSNQPALAMPFQRWFKFKEAFAPSFVVETLRKLPYRPESCLDPFGGSGTTALTCQFLGIEPATIEVNPFMADIIEAKLVKYDVHQLREDFRTVLRQARRDWRAVRLNEYFYEGPNTLVEPGWNNRWIFDRPIAMSIAALRHQIEWIKNIDHQRFLRVMLGSRLVELSNIRVNGKGRRYRNSWEKKHREPSNVFDAFSAACADALDDLTRFHGRRYTPYTLLRGDSRKLICRSPRVDVVLTSPPYPNSFDYTDIYNVELWGLGYLRSWQNNQDLRTSTVRSHVQIGHSGNSPTRLSPKLADAYNALTAKRKELWNTRIPEMICNYFDDMRSVLRDCQAVLNDGGMIVMAVGDSKYAGVVVDVPGILTEVGEGIGLRMVNKEAVRSMRSSAQQGGGLVLNETLISFSS